MTVRVEQTKTGTFVEWDGVNTPPTFYEVVPDRGVVEGEVPVEGDLAYGATFTAKPVWVPSRSAGGDPG